MNKSQVIFLMLCMPVRIFLIYLSRQPQFYKYISVMSLCVGLGFLTIWLFGLRTHGIETGGREIWWNNSRPIYALFFLLYFMSNHYDFHKDKAWIFISLSTSLGAVNYMNRYLK
jgi:hypothetical protein